MPSRVATAVAERKGKPEAIRAIRLQNVTKLGVPLSGCRPSVMTLLRTLPMSCHVLGKCTWQFSKALEAVTHGQR
jgi:hypothetical protein